MNYLKFDLGSLHFGKTVEVTLHGSAANVRLLDYSNFYSYVHGRVYDSIGGFITESPVSLTIPNHDHWFLVIDMEGLKGVPDASVKIR